MSATKAYYVYILASASRVSYTGVTNNLQRRILEHRTQQNSGFATRYRARQLVYFETFGDIRAAIEREKQIKGWRRAGKIALVGSLNPKWQDFGAVWRNLPRGNP